MAPPTPAAASSPPPSPSPSPPPSPPPLASASAAESGSERPRPWRVRASACSRRTVNPIRRLVDGLPLQPNPDKAVIALSIGDPTIFGNFGPPKEAVEAVREAIGTGRYNGYAPCVGYREAREAVAKYSSHSGVHVDFEDVILCSGCSSALELCIVALANPGDNILVPKPGFPLYTTLAHSIGVSVRLYDLRPERGWEADVAGMEQLVDARTAALLLNNPSNPCGSVWGAAHMRRLLAFARRHRLPVIADEIYEHLVFPGETFIPLAALSEDVPILSCSGLTKRFMVPGWRMGWVIIHDRSGAFGDEVKNALQSLNQRTIGANTIVQGALPTILEQTPPEYFEDTVEALHDNARLAFDLLSEVSGLRPVMPRGAMYMMVAVDLDNFPAFPCELAFVTALMNEESVFCLPGQCFDMPGYLRLVLTPPPELLREACERMAVFCARHRIVAPSTAAATAIDSTTVALADLAFAEEPAAAAAGGEKCP